MSEEMNKNNMSKNARSPGSRNFALFLVILLILFSIFYLMKQDVKKRPVELTYSEFITKAEAGQLKKAEIVESNINGELSDGNMFHTYIPYNDPDLLSTLIKGNVKVSGNPRKAMNPVLSGLVQILPWLLILGVFWVFMFRQIK